jgi:MoxR-like ATPase
MNNLLNQVETQINQLIKGKSEQVRLALICLLAEGHLLIEDAPGLGKTTLARAISASTSSTFRRIQFTPDLMPSDITGVSVYHQTTSEFVFHPGPIFANFVLADEINRASPRTQSAMLEVMAETTVTYDGISHQISRPFMVLATQNPVEMDGTYQLPEAQLDRFLMRISLGYPDRESEYQILRMQEDNDQFFKFKQIASPEDLNTLIQSVHQVHASNSIINYIVNLIGKTREHPDIRLGCSPRASIGLLRSAKAMAYMEGRQHVLPSDVINLVQPVLAHRIIVGAKGNTFQIVDEILSQVSVPPGDLRP